MMITNTQIVPVSIQPINYNDNSNDSNSNHNNKSPHSRGGNKYQKPSAPQPNGRTVISFATKQHCDLAFDAIPGPNRPDKANRDQKRIYLKGGGYVCIRKY